MSAPMRIAVLVSGGGTNLQALLDAAATGTLGAEIVLVVSNRPGVPALDRALRAGVPADVVEHGAYSERAAFDRALRDRLVAARVDLVVLAGFLRVLGPEFLETFAGCTINIHPSLLPAFPGVDAQRQAFERGVTIAGCTVHFVDASLDGGPIIAQSAVPLHPDDDPESFRARILAEEHRLLPAVVRWIAQGRVRVDGRRVHVEDARTAAASLRSPDPDG